MLRNCILYHDHLNFCAQLELTSTQSAIEPIKMTRNCFSLFTSLQLTELEWNFIANPYNYPDNQVITRLAVKFDKSPKQIKNWFKNQKCKKKYGLKKWQSNSTAHESTSSSPTFCSTSENSNDPMILCSDCPSCLVAQQNTVTVNSNPPSPDPKIQPNPLTPKPLIPSPCPHCESFSKIADPLNPMTTRYVEQFNHTMHIPWSNTSPLMSNWPDTSDLYRRMDHNLNRFVNDLI